MLGALVWFALPWGIALPSALLRPLEPGTRYLARDGSPLRHGLNAEGQRVGAALTFEQIPAPLLHATLAAEDKRFFSHGGLDLLAIARAAAMNWQAGRVLSGASTLTQQLIKISSTQVTSPPATKPPRTLAVKLREALQARHLEMLWGKERIAAEYLSRVSYGNLFTGCEVAAQGYFHKPLAHLTPAECAFLAALPQAPGRLNPFRNATAVSPRQQRILARMHELGWLSDEALAVAKTQPLVLQRFNGGFAAPHAVELLQAHIPEPHQPPTTILTTLDPALQSYAETVITTRLTTLRQYHVEHAAAVVLENATGHILALVGSRDYFASDGGQIDGAWVPHSPGSALKPFTYALAFERGATPASIVADLPIEFKTETGLYRPENYDHRLYGPMTYRSALGNSLNISAVRVLRSIGGAPTLLMALQNLGLSTLTEPAEHYGLGLTIGNAPVRLVELTNAYATLARLGLAMPWSLVPQQVTGQRVLSEHSTYMVADVLSDNQARVLTFGPRSPLQMPFRVACKTGTSTSYRDNWALGYTPEYTIGVWAGNFEGQPMEGVSGVTGAAPILRDLFIHLHEATPLTWYTEPPGLERGRIDPRTGHRLTVNSPPSRLSREDLWPIEHPPSTAVASDYDAQGRALLPLDYAAWLTTPSNWLGDLATTARSEESLPSPLKILSPTDGLVVHLDPDVNGGQGRLLLQALPEVGATWHCETLKLIQEGKHTFAQLNAGTHRLNVQRGAESVSVSVRVVRDE